MTRWSGLVVPVLLLAGCADDANDQARTTDRVVTSADTTALPTTTEASSSPTTTVPDTTEPPGTDSIDVAFSFAADDLCEWLTDEDVADILATAYGWSGTLVEEPTRSRSDGCQWILSGDPDGYLAVYDAGQWESFGGGPFDLGAVDIVPFRAGDPHLPEIGVAVSGHPALTDGVVVYNGAFGQFAFWVPPREDYLALSLAVPGVVDVFEGDRFFMVGDRLIRALGWADNSP